MLSYPLEQYFKTHPRPPIQMFRTSLHRGYIGTWKLIEDKLFLTSVEGMINAEKRLCMEDIFNNTESPIFAEWFTGSLFLPHGKFLRIEGSFNPIYEEIEEIIVKNGIFLKRQIKRYDKKHGRYS